MADMHISVEHAHERLVCDPEIGSLRWRPVGPQHTTRWKHFNQAYAGQDATFAGNGYRVVSIYGKHYKAHRLIWALVHGYFPPEFIDHINGDRQDNRIENLRLATVSQNGMNAKARHDGLKGAYRSRDRWIGRIRDGETRLYLGTFDSEREAHNAYCAAARRIHGEFARTS